MLSGRQLKICDKIVKSFSKIRRPSYCGAFIPDPDLIHLEPLMMDLPWKKKIKCSPKRRIESVAEKCILMVRLFVSTIIKVIKYLMRRKNGKEI